MTSRKRQAFIIDHLAENVDNIRLDSSHSASSFSWGSTSRETPVPRKPRPHTKPHINERKVNLIVIIHGCCLVLFALFFSLKPL